jgi:hypothetical protein
VTSCATTRLALGAYVLGALDASERAEVDAHLAGCAACRDQLLAFAPLPGLLSRLTADEIDATPATAPPELLDRTLARLRREQRRARRRQRWSVAVASAAVVVGLFAASATWRSSPPAAAPVPAPTVTATRTATATPTTAEEPDATLTATDPDTRVTATAELHSRAWGTEIGLRLRGVPSDERCRLVAVGADGVGEVAGSWAATYSGSLIVTNATSIQASQLRELRVVSFDGRTLVTIPVRA